MATIMMTRGPSKFLLFNFFSLSILLASISGLSPFFEHKELEREKEQKFHFFAKGLLELFPIKAMKHDLMDPSTTGLPTTPVVNPVTTPVNMPPDNSAPTTVTVPSTPPSTGIPNPGSAPPVVPSMTPPLTDPNSPNPPGPITNPVTTPSINAPPSNPVTTNPAPIGGVPDTTPVTPPSTNGAPATSGQGWCVAKSGAPQTTLQSALDYACGKGADCSAIQQGGSCYNPASLQNHASYAFNSYFQKNPAQTSCDFGGVATITNSNPSTGSCVFPSSRSPMPGTPSSSPPGLGAPPGVPIGSFPGSGGMPSASGFSDGVPPTATTSMSKSKILQPLLACVILVASMVTGMLVLEI